MGIKYRIYNLLNKLRGFTRTVKHGDFRDYTVVNDPVPPISPVVDRQKRHAGGRPSLDFDLDEALRLRAKGWGKRRIARQMNNVSAGTVRNRLREYDARQQAQQPKPVPAPEPSSKPPILPPAPRPPVMPVQEPKPAAVPVVPVVAPPTPFGLDSIPAGTKAFFLLNGDQNAILARNCAQIAVGVEQWHPSYASLPAFRDADRFWVVINSDDDNVAFLRSIVGDIWIRERCAVSRGDSLIGVVRWAWVQQVCKDRLLMQRANPGIGEEWWRPQFEALYFVPIPQPNHTRELEALLAPPPKPEKPSLGGSWGGPYGFTKYGGFGSNSH